MGEQIAVVAFPFQLEPCTIWRQTYKSIEMAEGECSRCVFRQEDVDFKNELIQLLSWHLMRQCFTTGALSRVGWIRTLQSEWHCCASMCPELWKYSLGCILGGERGLSHRCKPLRFHSLSIKSERLLTSLVLVVEILLNPSLKPNIRNFKISISLCFILS